MINKTKLIVSGEIACTRRLLLNLSDSLGDLNIAENNQHLDELDDLIATLEYKLHKLQEEYAKG